MDWRDHITVDPQFQVGKPIVRGTRISVELVIDLVASGWTHQQILDSYPTLKSDDVRACLAYAREILHSEKVFRWNPHDLSGRRELPSSGSRGATASWH